MSAGAVRVVGLDEVGRGSLAGPLCVGAAYVSTLAIDESAPPIPAKLRDSKLISALTREKLIEPIMAWLHMNGGGCAVGWATNREIDDIGISRALRVAALRALAKLSEPPDAIILDGSVDFIHDPRVRTRVKADRDCATVAAASVLAKCARDAYMTDVSREYPVYGWSGNKGYGAQNHRDAIAKTGPSPLHRLSWHLIDE